MATPPDFTTGQVLTAAQMNAVGLWLVKTQTIGSAVSSVTVTDAFSADYDNYLITLAGGTYSGARSAFYLQLGSSTTGYKSQIIYAAYTTTVAAFGPGPTTNFVWVGNALSNTLSMCCTLTGPYLTKHTKFSASWQADIDSGNATGIHTVAASYTSFVLSMEFGGTITGGTIRVYGYRN